MKIKSGDFVEINGKEVWVCNCKDAPLNGVASKKCIFCSMCRPTKRAPDPLKAGEKSAKLKIVKAKVIRPAKSG